MHLILYLRIRIWFILYHSIKYIFWQDLEKAAWFQFSISFVFENTKANFQMEAQLQKEKPWLKLQLYPNIYKKSTSIFSLEVKCTSEVIFPPSKPTPTTLLSSLATWTSQKQKYRREGCYILLHNSEAILSRCKLFTSVQLC